MYLNLSIVYLVLMVCYVLFSRQPDFFDGETAQGTIQQTMTQNHTSKNKIIYWVGSKQYAADADYVFRSLNNGEKLTVIYEKSSPEKGEVYTFWGYWLTWKELFFTFIGYFVLFKIAEGITSNPSPEALLEQLSYVPEKKTKYD